MKASPVDTVLVILGHRKEEIAANLEGTGVAVVENPRYREGMLTSIQAGFAAAPPDTGWFVIALADQPSLRPEVVSLLLAEAVGQLPIGNCRPQPLHTLLVPSYNGRRGHPLVIHASHREEVGTLDPEVGLRELMRRHPEAIRHLVVEEEAVLADMDTPEDYQREIQRLRS